MNPLRFLAFAAALSAAGAAPARGNLITYECVGLGEVAVLDGDPFNDLDPLENHIRVEIDCEVVIGVGRWRATGAIVGIFDPPTGATTRLENFTIRNTAGNVMGGILRVTHIFQTPLGPPAPENNASINGHVDNVDHPGFIGGVDFDYSAWVVPLGNDPVLIDTFGWVDLAGAAPIPIAHAGGPVTVIAPIAHKLETIFYLDSPGDAFLIGAGEGIDVESAPIPARPWSSR